MASVTVVFLQNSGGSSVGAFQTGEERDIPADIAKVFIERGVCKRKTSKVAKEKDNGRA